MNIQQAKEHIRKACIAYLSKDEFGDYLVPVEAQRPLFLLGAPGIGKTAIMAQVADELGLGLVDYSMTHHTRQSAIGLPFITHREYDGTSYDVSEYTMSEIIASVHECIERTGRREGILFLDEVNCVSETLAPAMLRFLQSKTFGNHRVPDGWVVTCAGNPLEYNRSAREFDVVTLDRVKRIEVEPDFKAWRAYAANAGAHPAVLSYLDLRPDHFYHLETKGRTRAFVTARAWMDLSTMLQLYERHDLDADAELVGQYVQVPSIARDFATYLELFATYTRDYRIASILAGTAEDAVLGRAQAAGFDERAALCGLLVDAMAAQATEVMDEEAGLTLVRAALAGAKQAGAEEGRGLAVFLDERASALEQELQREALRFRQDHGARHAHHAAIEHLRTAAAQAAHNPEDALRMLAGRFNEQLGAHQERAAAAVAAVENGLRFIADAFGEGNELTVCLTEITMNERLSALVAAHGCPAYFAYNERLMLDARSHDLTRRLDQLGTQLAES